MVSPDREQLRFLLPVPRADCTSRRGACGDQAPTCEGREEEGCGEEGQTCGEENGQAEEQEEITNQRSALKRGRFCVVCLIVIGDLL